MSDSGVEYLLARVQAAIRDRPIPPLNKHVGVDEGDWKLTVQVLGGLWSLEPAPQPSADLTVTTIALIGLSPAQFRFCILRLIESALQHPQGNAPMVVIEFAGEPVPRESAEPPQRFRGFSPDEIVLVRDCLDELIHRMAPGNLSDVAKRIIDRAARNWKRIAAATMNP